MKPPFSYYGGKQRLASKIVRLIPKHTVYVEPFAGGAAVFFAKPRSDVTNTNHYREVLNDIDGDIVNFYRVLQDKKKAEELIWRLQFTPYSLEEHQLSMVISKNPSGFNEVERAWAFFVDINMSFAYKRGGGWRRCVYSENPACTWHNRCSRLSESLERMAGVYIEHLDAIECISKWDAPQTLFYLDPPYVGTEQGHYSGYTQEDFEELIDTLEQCQGSFLLSCYDNPAIPKHWERFEFKAYCSASGKGRVGADRTRKATPEELGDLERTELILRVIRHENLRPEIRNLFKTRAFDCFEGEKSEEERQFSLW